MTPTRRRPLLGAEWRHLVSMSEAAFITTVADPVLDANVVDLDGALFARTLSAPPASAFVAEGSPVLVSAPWRLGEHCTENRGSMSHDIAHKEAR